MTLRVPSRYCPQFDALYDLLTVREHLELFARIKGISEQQIPNVVASLIKLVDLTKFENKRAGTLSGGNKRKLSVGIALIGEPPVIFLGALCVMVAVSVSCYSHAVCWSACHCPSRR